MLRTVVFPAPFGPMTDMISPRGTSKLTFCTACTPPNDLETSWISSNALTGMSSREPPLAPAVVFHITVTLALADPGQAQVELLDVFVVGDRLRVAVEDDAAVLHHVAVRRVLERDRRVLLREEDG